MTQPDTVQGLRDFQPQHDFFVGIDSDGCAFDTMEIKQKECFIPNTIKHWNLQAVSKYARQTAEFVNLYSRWRGINRWPALLMVFDLLAKRPEVAARKVTIPEVEPLRQWVRRESKLGHPALKKELAATGEAVLAQALRWSEGVNAAIEDMVKGVPPFPHVQQSLDKLITRADIFVVSQTPTEALEREWQEHKIDGYATRICGQEMGTKTELIRYAADGKYPQEKMLMIGDAPSDLEAARENGALFFPVNPGDEESSWQRFYVEALDRFLDGRYAGDYEARLIEEFSRRLPETPPWQNAGKQ
jgi:phosphoglycolate phosphatase-like HAD superfamily hydrolase